MNVAHRQGRSMKVGSDTVINHGWGATSQGATATPPPAEAAFNAVAVGWSAMYSQSLRHALGQGVSLFAVVNSAETKTRKRKTLLPPHKGEPRLRTLTGPLYAVA
jgi:hypothetical protein